MPASAELRLHALGGERGGDGPQAPARRPELVDALDDPELLLDPLDDSMAMFVDDVTVLLAERSTAHCNAAPTKVGKGLSSSFGDHRTLPLRDRAEDVQNEPAAGRPRVDRLAEADEGDLVAHEVLLDEVG